MKVSCGSEEQDCSSYLTDTWSEADNPVGWSSINQRRKAPRRSTAEFFVFMHFKSMGFSLLRSFQLKQCQEFLLFPDLLDISFETFWPCGIGASRTRFAHVSAKPDQSEKHVANPVNSQTLGVFRQVLKISGPNKIHSVKVFPVLFSCPTPQSQGMIPFDGAKDHSTTTALRRWKHLYDSSLSANWICVFEAAFSVAKPLA
jgi:hypothetical protein